MKPARQPSRLLKRLRLAAQLLLGLIKTPFYGNPFAPRGARTIRAWHAGACRALGIELVSHGQPAPGALYACNHISWLDIPVLGSQLEGARFLSKTEVRRWPLIGWLAARSGTLFLARGQGQQDANRWIADALRHGQGVVLFPEGTTTDGLGLRRFHARLLQAALDADAPVQPVAIRYLDADGRPNPRIAYIDDHSFGDTLQRIVAEDGLRAEIHFLPLIHPRDLSRSQIAAMAHAEVASALGMGGRQGMPLAPAESA
ncbi:MAG: 1-acyl-sn-glycerol-3-phosphate acyltransferase [Halothiobacillaceae bacterium]|nr:MAG: 1-acyl-sn-glycerol-3-phosphate acyltransferase [Halothiobacillaceae bacterium]